MPAVLADYQKEVAYAAIDAGADLILGHHAHILKGVEVYKGKAIFYSLCNFACDLRMDEEHANSKGFREIQALSPGWVPDFESLYNFPPASRLSMIARLVIRQGRVQESGFLPLYIDRDAVPRVVTARDPRFTEVLDYMRAVTAEAGLNGRFQADGDMVRITP